MVVPVLAELAERPPDRAGLTVFTQDDPAFPAGVRRPPRRRPGRVATGTATSRRCRRCCRSRRRRGRAASWAGRATEWEAFTGCDRPRRRRCPSSGRGAGRCRSTRIGPTSCACASAARVLRSRRVEHRRPRGRDGGDVRPRLDRRAAGRAADARPGCCGCWRAPPASPTRWSPSCRPTSSSAPSRRWPSTRCMAGCRPEYLPVVLAAVEAACTDEFNIHGLLATTYCRRARW